MIGGGTIAPRPMSARQRWLAFTGVQLGFATLFVDTGAMNLAIMAIIRDLRVDLDTGKWVIVGFSLATAMALLTAGRVADLVGRKPVLLGGFVLFAAGGVAAALAPSFPLLVAARLVQGFAAALMSATTLAITTDLFAGAERARALGIMSAAGAVAQVAGPIVAGQLLDWSGWRGVLLFNVPLALSAAALTLHYLPRTDPQPWREIQRSLDWAGAALSALAVGALVMAFERLLDGLVDAHTVGTLVGGAVLLVLFLVTEHQVAQPLLDLALFGRRTFVAGAVAFAAGGIAGSAAMFLLPQFLQLVLNYEPARAGALLAPLPLAIAAAAPFATWLAVREGASHMATTGLVGMVVGLVLLSFQTGPTGYLGVATGMVLFGLAMGLFGPTNNYAALADVAAPRLAIATAVLFVINTLASFVGVSLSTELLAHELLSVGGLAAIDGTTSGAAAGVLEAYLRGQTIAYHAVAVLAAIGILVAVAWRHAPRVSADSPS